MAKTPLNHVFGSLAETETKDKNLDDSDFGITKENQDLFNSETMEKNNGRG
jgi:hypothetical protein